jgi:hypothetical protein
MFISSTASSASDHTSQGYSLSKLGKLITARHNECAQAVLESVCYFCPISASKCSQVLVNSKTRNFANIRTVGVALFLVSRREEERMKLSLLTVSCF